MDKLNVKELFEDCVRLCKEYSNEVILNYRSMENNCKIIIKDCNAEISTIDLIIIGDKIHLQYIYLTKVLQGKGLCTRLLKLLETYHNHLSKIIVDTVLHPFLKNHLRKLGYTNMDINGFGLDFVKKFNN